MKPETRKCVVCYSEFTVPYSSTWQTCCSVLCRKSRYSQLAKKVGFQKGHPQYCHPKKGRRWSPEGKSAFVAGLMAHREEIGKQAELFRQQGYQVMDMDRFKPDLLLKRDGKLFAVEVELTHGSRKTTNSIDFDKWMKHPHVFDDVIWIVKEVETKKSKGVALTW